MAHSIQVASVVDMPEVVSIDDESMSLYETAGLKFELTASHWFTIAEQSRWRRSAEAGRLFFAVDESDRRVGFAALDWVDDAPYLDQLSVRVTAMRRGAGGLLVRHAIQWARNEGASFLWLTTYGHLPWNVPFYRRYGFDLVPEAECGPGIVHHLDDQRRALPLPEQRVAMRRPLSG
jgi:GNAT superfamily N-acetyltransferase